MGDSLVLAGIPMAVFLLAATITPGPNNIVIAACVVSHGYARTVPYILGVIVGFTVQVTVFGLGVREVFGLLPGLRRALEIGALAMLVWLSYKVATADADEGEGPEAPRAPPGFVFSVMFQWVNPKALTVSLSLVTLHLGPDDGLFSARMLLLVAVSVLVSIVSSNAWAVFGLALSRLLKNPRQVRVFNRVMGALLLVSAVGIFSL